MKTVVATLLLSALPLTASADSFNIRTGAWEVTTSTAMSGMLIPADALAKMPPDQRAKIEAMMSARAGKVDTRTMRSCVTPEDLARGQLMDKEMERKDCTRKVIAKTARHFEYEEVCPAPEPSTTHARFDAPSAETYLANVDMTRGEGKLHVDIRGRWLAAICKNGVDD